MKRYLTLIAPFLPLLIMAGCESAPLETDPTAYQLRGTLSGRVTIADYKAPAESLSGTTVSVEGTNYKAVTDSTGYWTISDLPAGMYTVSFTKEGFGNYKLFGQQFVGNGELMLNPVTLPRVPSEYSIVNFALDSIANVQGESRNLIFSGTISPGSLPSDCFITYFLSTDSTYDVATLGRWSYESGRFAIEQYPPKGKRSLTDIGGISLSGLYANDRFRSGDRIYVFAHVRYNRYSYFDPYLGRSVNTAISPSRSNVVSFVLP